MSRPAVSPRVLPASGCTAGPPPLITPPAEAGALRFRRAFSIFDPDPGDFPPRLHPAGTRLP
jgi:hypothetical protein